MPNLKSSKKRNTQNKKQQKKNSINKSILRTYLKKVYFSINSKNKIDAKNIFIHLQAILDRQSNKKIIHKNKSARFKSKIMKKINSINTCYQ